VADLRSDALERAFERRSIVRASLMRITLHVVTARDFWPIWTVMQPLRLDQWRLMCKMDPRDPRLVRRLRPAVEAARTAIEERPLRREDFTRVLTAAAPAELRDLPWRGLSRYFMAVQPLIQVPERGETYGRGRYTTAEAWLGAPSPEQADPDAAQRLLIRRHLAAFGPASIGDVTAWVGRRGSLAPWRAAIEALGDELVELRDPDGQLLLDLAAAPRPPADVPAPPRLLARWDSLLLAHESKRRGRVLPAAHHARVNLKNADVLPTFLVDGVVAGTWQLTIGRDEATITIEPFGRLRKAEAAALEAEATKLLEFVARDRRRRQVGFRRP
jgi:hypothetical protein